jgi:hypothetical protein
MLSLLLFSLAIAAPFEDVDHRFHLDLPVRWHFAPQPGDVHGAAFHRDADGAFANAMVRVMPFTMAVELDALASRVAAASDGEPGFRLLVRENSRVGLYPSIRRRFTALVNGDPRLPKMVEQQILVVGQTGYVLHGESLADVFPTFEADIMRMQASFVPGAQGAGAAIHHAQKLHRHHLMGQWISAGHTLALSQGGAITLDGAHGTFSLEGGALTATFGKEVKVYQLDLTQQGLTLTGEAFGKGVLFKAKNRSSKRK